MHVPRILALVVAVSLSGPRPLRAQEAVAYTEVVPGDPLPAAPPASAAPPPEPQPGREAPEIPRPHPARTPAALGAIFLGGGTVVLGVGVQLLRPRADGVEPMAGDHDYRGGVFVASGVVLAGVGTFLLGLALKRHLKWRAAEAKRNVALAPAVGRSHRGAVTAGLVLRF